MHCRHAVAQPVPGAAGFGIMVSLVHGPDFLFRGVAGEVGEVDVVLVDWDWVVDVILEEGGVGSGLPSERSPMLGRARGSGVQYCAMRK